MSEFTTFAGAENHALRILVLDGIRDFEVQVRNDPRMMDHIADSDMTLDDYRATHDRIATKLLNNEEFDHCLFDGDETQFVVALAEDGAGTTSYQNTDAGQAARIRDEQIIEKAKAMDQERRTTDSSPAPAPTADPLSERTYNRAALAAAGHHLETGDWDAHRKLAQIAVKSGYAAEVTQEYFNNAGTDTPLEHKIEILDPGEAAPCKEPGLRLEEETVLGSTISVEQFTPETPHGFFGPVTPLEDAPTDPEGPGNPVASDAHLSALSGQPPHPPAHSTGPSLT